METMEISVEVQLQEAKATIAHLEQRNLFLAQKLRQSFQIGFDYERQIAELKGQIDAMTAGDMEATPPDADGGGAE